MNINLNQMNSNNAAQVMMYQSQSKSCVLAVLLSVIWAGLGQIYAGRVSRGIIFTVAVVGLFAGGISMAGSDSLSGLAMAMLLATWPVWIYSWFDAYKCAKTRNALVFFAIFGEKDK